MELVVLGSGTSIPHPERGTSGYALRADDGTLLLLECGPGSTRRWPSAGIGFADVGAIAITHHHVDHCCDLAAVLFGRNVVEPPLETPLVLAGPIGHARFVASLETAYGSGVGDPHGIRTVVELDDGEHLVHGPFRVEARVVAHVEGALGFRVECDGATFAFSGDSGPSSRLIDLCRGVDLALVECSYPAYRESSSHLSTRTAAITARDAGVGHLVLTHFYPACDSVDVRGEVRAAGYEGPLTLAFDGLRMPIARRSGGS